MASSYPGGLDSFTTGTLTGVVSGADHGNKADAINKIEAELGINPSIGYATVLARLAALDANSLVNVKHVTYGAVGDGINDDTAEIQAAVDACSAAGGGVVFFPTGTYLISASISVPSFVTLMGVGSGARAVEYSIDPTSACSRILIGGAKNFPLIVNSDTAGGNTTIAIRDLRLQMSAAAADVAAIKFNKVRRALITGTYILGDNTTSRLGIHITGASEMLRIIDDVFLEGCGIFSDGSSNTITIRDIEVGQGGIRLEGGYFHQVVGCQVYSDGVAAGVAYPAWQDGIFFYQCNESIATHNQVANFRHDGIVLYQAIDCKVFDNVSVNNSQLVAGVWGGFLLDGGSDGCHISRNRAWDRTAANQAWGLRVAQSTGTTTNNQIYDNDFANNTSGPITVAAGVTGNKFRNNDPPVIPTTASAATVTLPETSDFHTISGTTNITAITAGYAGRRVTLSFSGVLTMVSNGTTLNLDSNYTTAAGDTISLESDGTNWVETSRSVQSRGLKVPVRIASTANVTISAPGATLDGVTMAAGDRMLLKDQTTASQNGIYVWNGAASAATRAPDSDTAVKLTDSLLVTVDEGTMNADTVWSLSTPKPITLGTTALRFGRLMPGYNFATRDPWSHGGNAIAATMDRNDVTNLITQTAITAICSFHGGMVVPGGRLITNINAFCTAAGSGAVTLFWWALVRQSDRVVLQRTANSTTLPTVDAVHTRALQAAITLDYDTPCYIALATQVATTSPSFAGVTGLATSNFSAPILTGNSGTTPTSTPPTVGAVLNAPAAGNTGRIHAWLS